MNVALEVAKAVATAIGRAWQKCVCRAIASKQEPRQRMAAVASGGEYDGGSLGNKLTTRLTITVKTDAAELATSLTAS